MAAASPSNRPLALRARTALGLALAVSMLVLIPSSGCAPARSEVDLRAALDEAGPGAYVAGTVRGLDEPVVVNRRDFVYAVDFGARARDLAFVHHVTTRMELTATGIEPLAPKFQQPINGSEFDVEDVAFLEGAGPRRIALPSRQGIARLVDAESGAVLAEHIFGVPLVRVAANPSSTLLAFGGADGTVLLLDGVTLAYRGEAKLHEDEVHALAFVDDATLLSAGWDKALVKLQVRQGSVEAARLPTSALKTGERVFLVHLGGVDAVAATRDVRQLRTVVTRAAVERLKLPTAADGATLEVSTAGGPVQAPAVELGQLRVKQLAFGPQRAAVCDACVPAGAEMVLGRDVLARALFAEEVATGEIVVRPGRTPGTDDVVLEEGAGARPIDDLLLLAEQQRVALPGPANDLDLDAARRTAVVAYSHARAERSFEIHDEEKKGRYPDPSPASGAVLVDPKTLALGARFIGHKGWTVTAAISPDGKTVATGGWDKRALVFDVDTGELSTERRMSWLVRRVRFSPDGRLLAVAAWTPSNPTGDGESEPALVLYPVRYDDVKVAGR